MTTSSEQLREEFEVWAKDRGYQRDELARCRLGIVSGEYFNLNTENAWKAYQAGRAALQSRDREPCFWTHDGGIDAHVTACGNAFIVGEGTPTENGMKFCCYCGGSLVEHIDHARHIEGDEE